MKAQLPPTMRAVVWRGSANPADMKVETLKIPVPKANEVLVKVKACGVCHTDLHCIKAEVPFPKPAVFGHEISGEVMYCGSEEDNEKFPPGTKVMSPFIMPCGSCSFCNQGEEDTCETFFAMNRLKGHLYDDSTRLFSAGQADSIGKEDEEIAMYSFAGLAEYAVVPKTAVFAIPEKILGTNLFEESCILGCAFFTAFGAIRNAAELKPFVNKDGNSKSPSVAVIGCGGVGGALLQLLKYYKISPILAIDVTDGALEQAKKLGADYTINSRTETDVTAKILEITNGKKVDVCFEVIGLKQTFEQAVMGVRDGGKACFIGISDVKTKAEIPITHIVRRRISMVGSYGARASSDMPALLDIAADGGIDLNGAITRRFTLDQAAEAYSLLNERKITGRAIVTL